jgi:stage IV sporulation protein FB
MRDLSSWSIPLGRIFGIQVKVHLLLPFIALGLILRAALRTNPPPIPGAWIDATVVAGLAFLSILFHELAHCFVGRSVGGEANEVLLWPLGGLAFVDLPHQPRAHFLTAAAGPASNVLLAAIALLALQFVPGGRLTPSWDPFAYYLRESDGLVHLFTWGGAEVEVLPFSAVALLDWFFRVNYILFLFNIVLVGFPMDSGRMLQSAVWPIWGYRQATLIAIIAGFVTVFFVALYGVVQDSVLALSLAVFIFFACHKQWFILETGGEDSLLGYDFSQGYTSLERDLPPSAPPRPRRAGFWQRWKQKRIKERLERQEAERVLDERRMDELLEKVQREGITALTDEERRFMKRVSDRYRNRH